MMGERTYRCKLCDTEVDELAICNCVWNAEMARVSVGQIDAHPEENGHHTFTRKRGEMAGTCSCGLVQYGEEWNKKLGWVFGFPVFLHKRYIADETVFA